MGIKKNLKCLLDTLERIGVQNEEIFDTDVREILADSVYCLFIARVDGFQLPENFNMFTGTANRAVRDALSSFLDSACPIASQLEWDNAKRQEMFQDLGVLSENGLTYDEFFGHAE